MSKLYLSLCLSFTIINFIMYSMMWPQTVTVLLRTERGPGVVAHDEAVRGPEVGERRGGGEEGGDRGGDTQHHGSSSLSLAIAMYESSTQH